MKFTFGDIYNSLKHFEDSARGAGVDIDNAFDDESRAILNDELYALRQTHMKLYNSDINVRLNINSVRKQIDVCMKNVDVFD